MRIIQAFNSFEFKQDNSIYNHISNIIANHFAMKVNMNRFLLLNGQAEFFKKDCQRSLIDFFREAISPSLCGFGKRLSGFFLSDQNACL